MPHSSDMESESRHGVTRIGKVIDLQGYLAAERALDLLIATDPSDPLYQHRLADAISVGASMLAVIVRRLDAYHPDALEALGRAAAAFPHRKEAVAQLTRAANDRRSTDARRVGAMLILEYCLGAPAEEDFLSTLRDPTTALAMSFQGAACGAARSPVLQSYVQALLTQPSELLYAVFSRLVALEGDVPPEVARLLALHPDAELSLAIVDALATQGSRTAVQCLALLAPTLSLEAGHAAARALHKLRLAGYNPRFLKSPDESCRALLSPVDGGGNRLLILLAPGSEAGTTAMLEMYLSEGEGLLEVCAYPACGQSAAPRPADLGHRHNLPLKSWVPGYQWSANQQAGASSSSEMLEVPYLYGLDVLRESIKSNWLSVTPLPLAYCLLVHLFWLHSDGLQDASFRFEESEEGLSPQLAAREADLLMNPAFDSWYLASPSARDVAEEISTFSGGPPKELTDDNWRLLLPALIRLAHDEFSPHVRDLYAARLRSMAEWLRLAGHYEDAAYAASSARTMLKSPPETNLLVLRLVQRGILVALGQLGAAPKGSRAYKPAVG